MQVQRPSDTSQWISGTSTWGQKVAENENDWTKVPSVAPGSNKLLWSSSVECKNALDPGIISKPTVISCISKIPDLSADKFENLNVIANLGASASWCGNVSTVGTINSNVWGGIISCSGSSTWESCITPTCSILSQVNNMQVGSSSVCDGGIGNASISASVWGQTVTNQLPLSNNCGGQSHSCTLPNNIAQPSVFLSVNSSLTASFESSNTLSWQNIKPYGMSEFSHAVDTGWINSQQPSSLTSTSNHNFATGMIATLPDTNKLELALGNLSIDKSAPPPDINWIKSGGWCGAIEPRKSYESAIVGGIDNSLQYVAAQKSIKPIMPVLTPKEEEIRRAIDANEGWGTKPIRQDTSWDLELSPKTSRKLPPENSEITPSNVWNNNNGTAIWECARETNRSSWSGGVAAAGGSMYTDKDHSSWATPRPNVEVPNWMNANNPMMNMPLCNNPVANVPLCTNQIGSNPLANSVLGNNIAGNSHMNNNLMSYNQPVCNNQLINNNPMCLNMIGNNPLAITNNPMISNPMVNNALHPMANNAISDKTVNNWGDGDGQHASSKIWGNKTETGSWNEPPQARSITWNGQDTDVGMWEDPATASASRRIVSNNNASNGSANVPCSNIGMTMPVGFCAANNMPLMMPPNTGMNVGSVGLNMGFNASGNMSTFGMASGGMSMPGSAQDFWSDPSSKLPNWNSASGSSRPKSEEVWNKGNSGRLPGNGWLDTTGNNGQRVDDGTSIWTVNAQDQPRVGCWGDSGAAWNPSAGASNKTCNWTGSDQDWQRKLVLQRFSSGGGGGGGGGHHTQMRSKLLQQLMDMGFKKDDAQNALISNNMNFDSAVAELTNGMHKKDVGSFYQPNSPKFRQGGGYMSESTCFMGVEDTTEGLHYDVSPPSVPSHFSTNNGPFSNAQLHTQSFMPPGVSMFDRSKMTTPMPPGGNSFAGSMQQKLKAVQQPVVNNLSPTPGGIRGQSMDASSTQNVVQHHAAQQRILQQLHLAVQSGLIPPQLLNQQLPHNVLLMLQQLLQLQNALQNMQQRQQFLLQNKSALNIPRPQLDHMSTMINQYRSQIVNLQKQLNSAQQSLTKQQPPSPLNPTQQQQQASMPVPPSLQQAPQFEASEISLSLNSDVPSPSGGLVNTSMSRLSQWKQQITDRELQIDLNRAPGSKSVHHALQHSHSSSSRGAFADLTGLNIGGDTTWSSTPTSRSSNWPNSSVGDYMYCDRQNSTVTSPPSVVGSLLGGGRDVAISTDGIPEFIPGKPWQGLNSKNVEDDPHITPGSFSRSLSVNVVRDDYLNNLAGSKTGGGMSFGIDSSWSIGKANAEIPVSASRLVTATQWSAAVGFSRQDSWAGKSPGSAFTQVSGSTWENRQPSSWMKLSSLDDDQ